MASNQGYPEKHPYIVQGHSQRNLRSGAKPYARERDTLPGVALPLQDDGRGGVVCLGTTRPPARRHGIVVEEKRRRMVDPIVVNKVVIEAC